MMFRGPWVRGVFAGIVAVPSVLTACGGRGPLDTDIAAYDEPDAPGLLPRDEEDASARKDSSTTSPSKDATAAEDSGTGLPGLPGLPGFPGLPGLPGLSLDAGVLGCFSCAQNSCGSQINKCIGDSACVQGGLCDVRCLAGGMAGTGSGSTAGGLGGLLGLNTQCLGTCGSDPQATQELTSAALCIFTSCESDCLSALTSLGTGLGNLGSLFGGAASSGSAVPSTTR